MSQLNDTKETQISRCASCIVQSVSLINISYTLSANRARPCENSKKVDFQEYEIRMEASTTFR